MGQIFAFFRSIGQRCGRSSDREETESVTTETTALTLRDTQVSAIAASTADPVVMDTVTESEQTDHDVDELSDTGDWFETDPGNTDTDGDLKLSDRQVEDLAQIIVSKHMATIAIKYLGLPHETIENLKLIRQGDFAAFNRELIVLWRNKNPGINQIQVLFRSSKMHGNIVRKIAKGTVLTPAVDLYNTKRFKEDHQRILIFLLSC